MQADPRPSYPDLVDPLFWDCYFAWRETSLLSVERLFALYRSIVFVQRRGLPGAYCECGVYRGGSSCFCAAVLLALGQADRPFFWFDTFAGFLPGVDADSITAESLQSFPKHDTLPEALENFGRTGYPANLLTVVRGPVETTLPQHSPDQIAVLHLDMDYPAATTQALAHLYPRLTPQGLLHIDDYGHFPAVGRAVEDFFAHRDDSPLLVRVDYTGRVGAKPV